MVNGGKRLRIVFSPCPCLLLVVTTKIRAAIARPRRPKVARQRHREPPRCPRRKSPTSLIDSQVVKTTPSVMHKCQAVIVGPQDHEIDLIVAILEIVNTPPRRHIPVGSQGSCRGRGCHLGHPFMHPLRPWAVELLLLARVGVCFMLSKCGT